MQLRDRVLLTSSQLTWLALIAILLCLSTAATAQCPIQLRQASFDASRKTITIRYYNSGTYVIRDVQFELIDENARASSVVGNFSAKNLVRPKQEQTVVFPNVGGQVPTEGMYLEVLRVSFADHSSWVAHGHDTCKVGFTEP